MKYRCILRLQLTLATLLSLSISFTHAQSLFPIRMNALTGEQVVLTPSKSAPITVFVFLLPDCPACQSYTRTLNEMHKEFSGSGIRFIGVFAGKFAKPDEMIGFSKEYQLPFPLYTDKEHSLIRKLDVHVVPEVVVCGPDGKTIYSGRIDDWMYAAGRKRTVIRHHDLKNALNAIRNGKKPEPKHTVPVGCIIE